MLRNPQQQQKIENIEVGAGMRFNHYIPAATHLFN
jgi:hypothetical protein